MSLRGGRSHKVSQGGHLLLGRLRVSLGLVEGLLYFLGLFTFGFFFDLGEFQVPVGVTMCLEIRLRLEKLQVSEMLMTWFKGEFGTALIR